VLIGLPLITILRLGSLMLPRYPIQKLLFQEVLQGVLSLEEWFCVWFFFLCSFTFYKSCVNYKSWEIFQKNYIFFLLLLSCNFTYHICLYFLLWFLNFCTGFIFCFFIIFIINIFPSQSTSLGTNKAMKRLANYKLRLSADGRYILSYFDCYIYFFCRQ